MNFEQLLEQGVEKGIISSEQKECLLGLTQNVQQEKKKQTSAITFFYYLGGVITFCAMCTLMMHTIQNGTYFTILALGSFYAAIFIALGEYLWRKDEKLPAGIMHFLFVTTCSLIFMDIEKMIGFFPHFSDMYKYDNFIEACRLPVLTLSVATIVLNWFIAKCRPHAILAIPTISSLYAIYYLIADIFLGKKISEIEYQAITTFIYSVLLFLIGFWKDKITKVDYSYWFYFIANLGFVYSLSLYNKWENLLPIFVLGIIYVLIGTLIQRKFFTVIGILLIVPQIFSWEHNLFNNHPTGLTSAIIITGLLMLYVGVLYNRNIEKVTNSLESVFPQNIRKYLPRYREKSKSTHLKTTKD